MSHGIKQHDRLVALQPTWHRLETIVPEVTLANSGLDWPAITAPLYYEDPSDGYQPVEEKVGVIRPDKGLILGVVSPRYKVCDNSVLWKSIETALRNVPHTIEVAGSLNNCRKVFVSVRLHEHDRYTVAGDAMRNHLTFYNSHDGTERIRCYDTSIRVVCQNTLNMSLAGRKAVDWHGRHTEDTEVAMRKMRTLLDCILVNREQTYAAMEQLDDRSLNADECLAIVAGFVEAHATRVGYKALEQTVRNVIKYELSTARKNTIRDIAGRFGANGEDYGIGNQGRSRYDALNAMTEYGTRGQTGSSRPTERTFGSSEFGRDADRKAEFFRLLTSDEALEHCHQAGRQLVKLAEI